MTRESRAEVLGAAIACGLVGKCGDEDEDVAMFMDLDLLAATLAALKVEGVAARRRGGWRGAPEAGTPARHRGFQPVARHSLHLKPHTNTQLATPLAHLVSSYT